MQGHSPHDNTTGHLHSAELSISRVCSLWLLQSMILRHRKMGTMSNEGRHCFHPWQTDTNWWHGICNSQEGVFPVPWKQEKSTVISNRLLCKDTVHMIILLESEGTIATAVARKGGRGVVVDRKALHSWFRNAQSILLHAGNKWI